MGQKINPVLFRTGRFLPWRSRWFGDGRSYRANLLEDIKIRKLLEKKLKSAGVTTIEIERLPKSLVIIITVSRPGLVIGRGGSGLEELKKITVEAICLARKDKKITDLKIDFRVNEVKHPELSAKLVAERIVFDLERRIPHRRAVTKAVERVMQSGALGVKVVIAGRIDGADIARVAKFHQGSVPTQTMRERIDYAEVPALTRRGYVGVKVYVHRKSEEE